MSRYDSKVRLDKVVVRPIRTEEKKQWCQLMKEHHYLGFQGIVGESILYIATIEDRWLALIGWGASALKVQSRDEWIGWDTKRRLKRLQYIANNVRFLILPGAHIQNLASKVLSKNIHRLSADWEIFYNHPILLAETFVDISRFTGACYKAAGWIDLGKTLGFTRRRTGYVCNGQPKKVFVFPLHRQARKILSDPYPSHHLSNRRNAMGVPVIDVNRLPIEGEGGLIDILKKVKEPRKLRGIRHSIVSILAIAICACLAGMRCFTAIGEWAENLSRERLKVFNVRRRNAPSESTIRRALQKIDPQEVDNIIGQWLLEKGLIDGKTVGLDGKTLRGSHDDEKKPIHLLSAILNEEGIIIGQCEVEGKTNEITKVSALLEDMKLDGAIITADALHTQVNTASYIVKEKKADYVFTVKDNQPTLRDDIESLHMEAFPPSAPNN